MFHCPVLAYIDPMSGAIVLQVIIGGIIGSVALFRRSIKLFIVKILRRDPPPVEPDED